MEPGQNETFLLTLPLLSGTTSLREPLSSDRLNGQGRRLEVVFKDSLSLRYILLEAIPTDSPLLSFYPAKRFPSPTLNEGQSGDCRT